MEVVSGRLAVIENSLVSRLEIVWGWPLGNRLRVIGDLIVDRLVIEWGSFAGRLGLWGSFGNLLLSLANHIYVAC